MAAVNPAQALQNEATCPICLDFFNDPVSLGCDHSFCRACISHCWEGSETISCPQCRKTFSQMKVKPNRLLRNVVEAARGLRQQSEGEATEREGLCEEHKEPLKLFCKDDEVPICLVCDRSTNHSDHTVIPAEEAAEEYKEKIQVHLKTLREEREKLKEIELNRNKRSEENLMNAKIEVKNIEIALNNLSTEFLWRQENSLLRPMMSLDDIWTMNHNYDVAFSEEISRLSDLISEMERKCEKPGSIFLQDVRSMLSRYEKRKFQAPEISPELENPLNDVPQRTPAVMETIKTLKDTLRSALEGKGPGSLRSQDEFAATVTLDPDTAHPDLILSEDGRSARFSYLYMDDRRGNTRPELLENSGRFDTSPCVLGREGFTSGRHSWEVEVGDGKDWAVGVAKESVKRKGEIIPSPEMGIWGVRWSGDQFWGLTSPETLLPERWVPRRIRVYLDCYLGQVTFFDADDGALIFTLPLYTCRVERFHPWFWVGIQSWVRMCP